jgi:hypothetical protein
MVVWKGVGYNVVFTATTVVRIMKLGTAPSPVMAKTTRPGLTAMRKRVCTETQLVMGVGTVAGTGVGLNTRVVLSVIVSMYTRFDWTRGTVKRKRVGTDARLVIRRKGAIVRKGVGLNAGLTATTRGTVRRKRVGTDARLVRRKGAVVRKGVGMNARLTATRGTVESKRVGVEARLVMGNGTVVPIGVGWNARLASHGGRVVRKRVGDDARLNTTRGTAVQNREGSCASAKRGTVVREPTAEGGGAVHRE